MSYGKCIAALFLMLATVLVTGCWDRVELNDVGVLLVTAIDKDEKTNQFKAQTMFAVPRSGNNNSSGPKVKMSIQSKGDDLDKVRLDLDRQLSRQFVTTHRRVFIVSESLARDGIEGILDQISRSPKNRLKTYFVVARNAHASKLINMEYELDPTPGEVFREIVKTKVQVPTSLREIFISSITPGIEPVAAGFTNKTEENAKAALDSIALFKGFKLVGFVDDLEAVALNSMLNKKPFGIVELMEEKGKVLVALDTLKVKPDVSLVNNVPQFLCHVKATAHINENQTPMDVTNPQYIEKLNKELEQELEQVYKSLFYKLQRKYEVDSAGLGAVIYRKDPDYWKRIEKNWPSMYRELPIQWQLKADIAGVGSSGANLFIQENELIK
ncbi:MULTISPECIES: Ger(x)C family spore germination protein [Paenibacillus]|uniref:Ger(x)C family spore germination protein n=1 Tax=Paenibacillus TaxID=44249 RepID=UPI0022B85C3D|nr:Ger(x)C family spore germination protein [Paenibacillus caseinilyticus]MCZ8522975.1 Ger(x)C family spore germination protein [Paenibacillus caseinilyticus]